MSLIAVHLKKYAHSSCFIVFFLWPVKHKPIYPYPSRLLLGQWGNHTIPLLAVKQTSWCRHQMETFSVKLVLWEGYHERPVTQSFGVFFDLCLNKRLSKQSWGWWFETPSRSLWCHCNGVKIVYLPCNKILKKTDCASSFHFSRTLLVWRQRLGFAGCHFGRLLVPIKTQRNMEDVDAKNTPPHLEPPSLLTRRNVPEPFRFWHNTACLQGISCSILPLCLVCRRLKVAFFPLPGNPLFRLDLSSPY